MIKLFELNSIRSRMVTGFLFLTLLILILAVASLIIIDRITKASRIHSGINQLESSTLYLIQTDNDFFDRETTNMQYFKTQASPYLYRHDSLIAAISNQISTLLLNEKGISSEIQESLTTINATMLGYNKQFSGVVKLLTQKGFRDFGMEGKMRFHAHNLENSLPTPLLVDLLYLRRHEKDFLLRNDTNYVQAFKKRIVDLKAKTARHSSPINLNLQEYERHFLTLVKIQQTLGVNSNEGKRFELNALADVLRNQYYTLSSSSNWQTERDYHKLRILYLVIFSGAIIFSIVSGYWISKKLSAPITSLSRSMYESIIHKNTMETDFSLHHAAIEIATLAKAFNTLLNKLKEQLTKTKNKSRLLKIKNKELKKLNRELDNFLYSTAHDLRSPLSSLLGLINIIRHENQQPGIMPYIEMMEKSIQRSENFIGQIVNYSKNKRLENIIDRIDLLKVIENIFEDHQFVEGNERIKKVINIKGSFHFYSDPTRINIILNNLISNAIKYADLKKETPYILINIEIYQETLYLEFIDNGLGIAPNHLSHIFKMFYRAHETSKGSGLGLFIFKETITKMNGLVSVNSTVGGGTKFILQLPNATPQATTQPSFSFANS